VTLVNSLQRQLEMARFERAMEVAQSLADHRALLTTAELGRLNVILTGKDADSSDPWRQGPITVKLPSGREETLQLIADPKINARDILHRATALAESGAPVAWHPGAEPGIPLAAVAAAVDIYASLVLSHVFQDANRRTAALAAHYFLKRYGAPISGLALHEIGLGDLREEGQIESLRETVVQMAKFALKRSKK
jgi:hypothetical protein